MEELRDLKPGEVQFLSSYKPSLLPGDYRVDISQTVVSPSGSQSRELKTKKKFKVEGPSPYRLPAGSIHSVFPAEGEAVLSKTLPQVTLSDPHLPWELSPDNSSAIAEKHLGGSLIPWVALLVFTEDELKTLPTINPQPAVSPTLSVRLSKRQLKELKSSSAHVPLPDEELGDNPEEAIDTIFVNSAAIRAYFSAQMNDDKDEQEPAIARYSYLSHIRRSRSTKAQDPTTNTFIIALGHRSGPLALESNSRVTAYAHLVSLMGVPSLSFPEPGSPDLTALVSLYSWKYSWIPGNDAEIEKVIKTLSDNVRPLRRFPEQPVLDEWLKRRLEAGYTLVKHRMQTGEQTVSLFRGPFTPHRPKGDELHNAEAASPGSGLQIIDQATGLIDITYSASWSLGRSLAIENSAFTMAISALRTKITQIYKTTSSAGFTGGDSDDSQQKTLPDWYRKLQQISQDVGESNVTSMSEMGSRWKRAREKLDGSKLETAMSGSDPDSGLDAVRKFLQEEVDILVEDKDWYARELVEPTQEGLYIAKVLDFVYNQLLTLRAVPQNYMFPEPDILDTEAILTFYVDPLWVDTLIDGALSIGSHSTVDEDITRNEIKRAINSYLAQAEVRYKHPRVPQWGAVICGSLLAAFGDPRIRTGSSTAPSPQLLINTKLHERALLLIFNCRPGDLPEGLTISQPPHQQSFAAGTVLTEEKIIIEPVAAIDERMRPETSLPNIYGSPDDKQKVFSFETRCLVPSIIMREYTERATYKGIEAPKMGSSALMSFALGDKLHELRIKPTENQEDRARGDPIEPFQLSTEIRHKGSDQLDVNSLNTFSSSSGSIPLGCRVRDEPITSENMTATIERKRRSDIILFHATATADQSFQDGQQSLLTASCRVLKQHVMPDGTRAVDLTVVINTEKIEGLDVDRLRRINVAFPFVSLVDPTAKTLPRITLFGSGSARWVSGCAYVSSKIPAFVVQLRPRTARLVKTVDFGFLLSGVALSDSLSDGVVLTVEEEYIDDTETWNGNSGTTFVRQLCQVEGLDKS
ncbi:hypothetical protein FBEOM_12282 [Fusarium beomiforme]|uniref:Uncharacterized protein n=1 Tax=Fusarium beomiforme TaxID=44412 RepID=A0A9P5A8C5_9HYPO|nr:hypothetical protein FBEOM_12282 [Fusarium beomiforme]